jgi:hypothetical protein
MPDATTHSGPNATVCYDDDAFQDTMHLLIPILFQDHLFRTAGVNLSHFNISPTTWTQISEMAMSFRETVHYNLPSAAFYDW